MSWFSKLRNAYHSKRLDEEIAEEIQDHLTRRAAELAAQGMSETEARQRAAVSFGNRTRVWEMTREARLWNAVESCGADIRYALRGMRKNLGFTLTAVLSLGLAIGANTAIYSIVDAALLRPLPVGHPEELVSFAKTDVRQPGEASTGERLSFSYPMFRGFCTAARAATQLLAVGYPELVEKQGKGADVRDKIMQQWISGNGFKILQTGPAALGRLLTDRDDAVQGGSPYAVLSYDYWQRHYGGNPGVLGKSIRFTGATSAQTTLFEIVGVAPKGFFGIEPGKMIDVWLPIGMYEKEALVEPGENFFRIMARLTPGSTTQRLQQHLQPTLRFYNAQIVSRIPTMPEAIRKQFVDMPLRVHPASTGLSQFRQIFARPLWIVLGVALGILLIACANVSTLLLARSAAHSPEMAMRLSLGAGRGRLTRQLLTEGLLLSVMAGVLGWLLAKIVAPALLQILSTKEDPVRLVLALDTRVLLFCALICTATTLLFGLMPAWQSARVEPMLVLRRASGQAGKLRLGHFFVGLQVAFAFCLVMAGASFLFTLRNLLVVNTGFDARGVTVLSMVDQAQTEQKQKRLAIMNEMRSRLRDSADIENTATAAWPLFTGTGWEQQVILPGRAPSEREEIFYRVSPGYFATLRTPLIAGRDFGQQDDAAREPISTIVNRAFARRYFGSGQTLGQTFRRPEGKSTRLHRIVGVVADANYGDLRRPAPPIVYVPIEGRSDFVVYARSWMPVGPVVRITGGIAKQLGSDLHVSEATTLNALVGDTILQEKLLAGLGGVFAVLGLGLAAIGLFGLLNYSVVRRTKELGIRGALGAQQSELVTLVFRDLLRMTAGGLVAGLAGSLMVLLTLHSLLFGVRPVDPLVTGTALGVFVAAAVIAGWIPALRASRVDPMVALRQE